MRSVVCLLLFLFSCVLLCAQEDNHALGILLEQWAEQNDSESVPDDVVELLQSYLENPINLNDTSSQELEDIPFISDLQREVIRAYIAQNGEMASLAELHLMNGFDSVTLRLLMPFVTVAPVQRDRSFSIKEMLQKGRSNLRLGTKTVLPYARGYKEDIYAGSPFRVYFRYNFKFDDRISFQLSGDKDAGESFRDQSPLPGFDYYGYHLMFSDFGIVKRAIVGKYQMQFGQGTTLWSGYAPWMSGSMPLWRNGQGIRAASAFCEYGYLHGGAVTLSLRKSVELSLFYSNADRDASTADADTLDGYEQQFQTIYQSGYHRTENEIAKEGILNEQLYGGHLQYRGSGLIIGATAYRTMLSNTIAPARNVYNAFAFRGKDNINAGVDFSWRYRRLLLFGEASLAMNDSIRSLSREYDWLPIAAVMGAQLHLNANNNISIAYRYGSPIYQNLHANVVGQSSSAQNEEGLTLFLRSRLPFYISLQGSVDFFSYPWLRYRVYSPSTGVDYRIALSKEIVDNMLFTCQYRYKSCDRNGNDSLYWTERTNRQQLHLALDYSLDDGWRFLSRLVFTWFDCEDHSRERGFLVSQEVSYNASRIKHPFSLCGRIAAFDVSTYDARIFTYESDLMYEFAVPMLMGRGVRCYLVFRQDISRDLSFALKYAVSFYSNQDKIGSGYETIDGAFKHELKAQLRFKF